MTNIIFCHSPDISEKNLVDFFEKLEFRGLRISYVNQFKPIHPYLKKRWLDPWPRGKRKIFRRLISSYFSNSAFLDSLRQEFGPELTLYHGSDQEIKIIDKIAFRFIRKIDPEAIICWGEAALPYGPIGLLGRKLGIKVCISENSLVPGGMRIVAPDRFSKGYSDYRCVSGDCGISVSSAEIYHMEKVLRLTNFYRHSNNMKIDSAIANLAKKQIYKRIILFIGGGETFYKTPISDSMRRLFPLYSSYAELFSEFSKHKDNLVIYKPHPSTLSKIDFKSEGLNNMIESNSNIDQLIEICDVAIAHGSHVEVNVLLRGKPLGLLGVGFFWKSDLVKSFTSQSEFSGWLGSNCSLRRPNKHAVLKFLRYVCLEKDIFLKRIGDLEFCLDNEVQKFMTAITKR